MFQSMLPALFVARYAFIRPKPDAGLGLVNPSFWLDDVSLRILRATSTRAPGLSLRICFVSSDIAERIRAVVAATIGTASEFPLTLVGQDLLSR